MRSFSETYVTELRNSKLGRPWLTRLVSGLSSRKPGFSPSLVHLGFVVNNVAVENGFLRKLQFSPFSIILPTLYTLLLIYHQHYVMSATGRFKRQNDT